MSGELEMVRAIAIKLNQRRNEYYRRDRAGFPTERERLYNEAREIAMGEALNIVEDVSGLRWFDLVRGK